MSAGCYDTVMQQDLDDVKADIKEMMAKLQAENDATKAQDLRDYKKQLVAKEGQLLQQRHDLQRQMAGTIASPGSVQLDERLEQLTNAVVGLRTDMEPVIRVCVQRLSATIAASEGPEDKLRDVRRSLNCRLLTITASESVETEATDSMDPFVDALLQAPRCKDVYAFGWQEGLGSLSEPQQRCDYLPHMKTKLRDVFGEPLPRKLCWANGNGRTYKFQPEGLDFPLSSRNDELFMLKNGESTCLVGMKVKKTSAFDLQALPEAETEFYVFDSISAFPFVQVCSDLNRGGFVYYTTGADAQGTKIVWRQVLHGMHAVYTFLADLLRAIPSNVWLVQPDEQDVVFPSELQAPRRWKLHTEDSLPAGAVTMDWTGGSQDDSFAGGGGNGGRAAGSNDEPGGSKSGPTGSHPPPAIGAGSAPGSYAPAAPANPANRRLTTRKDVLRLLSELQQEPSDVANLKDVDDIVLNFSQLSG